MAGTMDKGTAPAPPAPVQHDGLAIASLICAFFIPPLGIVFGHVSRHMAKKEHRPKSGIALAGLILGWIFTAITAIGIIVAIAVGAAVSSTPSSSVQSPVPSQTSAPATTAPPSSPSTPSPAAPSGPEMLAMGESEIIATDGTPSATITVSSPAVTTQPADQYGSAPQNGYFVTVTVKVTADQAYTDGFDINPLDFYALSGGRHFDWDSGNAMFALASSDQELSAATLAAGETTSGKLVFDVSSPHGYIVYAPNLDGQPLAEWKY
jgi:hypothetical protein